MQSISRRSIQLLIPILMAMTVMLYTIHPSEATPKRVAVMPLEKLFVLSDSTQDEETVAQIMSEQLLVALQDSGNYTVVERAQFDKALKELGFQSIYSDPDYAMEMGKAFGAERLLLGKITMVKTKKAYTRGFINKVSAKFDSPYRCNISLDLRLVDCKTSKVELAKTVEGDRGGKDENEALYNACKQAAQNFMQEVQANTPFMGRILEINGNDIYIDQGIESGLHKDETLQIVREGVPLESGGQIIGMTLTDIGKAKVVEVTADYAICRAISGNEAIQKGDIVKRIRK